MHGSLDSWLKDPLKLNNAVNTCLTLTRLVVSKNVSSRERVKSCFFMTFNIIISHIFPQNFIDISQVIQKT